MRNILSRIIITILAGSIPLLTPLQALAASSLTLSPSSVSKIWPNNTFSVQVLESSGTTPVNAVLAKLTYPTAMLTCSGISVTGSAFVIPGSGAVGFGSLTSCGSGAVTIVEGSATDGPPPAPLNISGNNKLVATINFKVNAAATPGSAALNFDVTKNPDGTTYKYLAVVNGSTNTNDLGSSTNGTYTVCKIADLNCDGTVNYLDAGIFVGVYGTTSTTGDFNSDGKVDYLDAGIFVGKYGT